MTFTGLNLLGVAIAFVISFISGGAWFGPKTFYPILAQERAKGSTPLGPNQNKPALLFGGTALALIIQILTLALIINSLQIHNPELGAMQGAGIGFALGLGISAFSSLSHRLFAGENLKVWIIETSNDVLNLTIAGAVIAFFN